MKKDIEENIKILVFSKAGGFVHSSIPDGIESIRSLGKKNGWTVEISMDSSVFSDADLARFDVVVWNNNCVNDDKMLLTGEEQKAFERFIQSGKGFVGIHCASQIGLSNQNWPWFYNMLGAVNLGHPSGDDQFQSAEIKVENHSHRATVHLPEKWILIDEWFYYDKSPRESADILLSLNEKSYRPGKEMGDHPIAWCREYDGGRMFFTGIGHRPELFQNENFLKHLEGGILYGAGYLENPVTKDLLLDLNGDCGLTLEEGNRVVKWENQAKVSVARYFEMRNEGRTIAGSGRPVLISPDSGLKGHNALSFHEQELVNREEGVFNHLICGCGYTWFAVVAASEQDGKLPDVNVFFGNLKNSDKYEGFWGGFNDDRTVWTGARNGITFGRFDENNPKITGPVLEADRYYIVAGRMGAGTGTVDIELFANSSFPVSTGPFPVNPEATASKFVIGTERDAVNHPGKESFDGKIGRFLVYERPLSPSEMRDVIIYLKTNYLEEDASC